MGLNKWDDGNSGTANEAANKYLQHRPPRSAPRDKSACEVVELLIVHRDLCPRRTSRHRCPVMICNCKRQIDAMEKSAVESTSGLQGQNDETWASSWSRKLAQLGCSS